MQLCNNVSFVLQCKIIFFLTCVLGPIILRHLKIAIFCHFAKFHEHVASFLKISFQHLLCTERDISLMIQLHCSVQTVCSIAQSQ